MLLNFSVISYQIASSAVKNNTLGNWRKIIPSVPQRPMVGPLLFTIFINDIFFSLKDIRIGNYADNNTLSSKK